MAKNLFCITSHFSKFSKQPPALFSFELPVHFKNTICKDCRSIRILWLEVELAFTNGNIASIEGLKAKVGPWLGVVPDQSVQDSVRNLIFQKPLQIQILPNVKFLALSKIEISIQIFFWGFLHLGYCIMYRIMMKTWTT